MFPVEEPGAKRLSGIQADGVGGGEEVGGGEDFVDLSQAEAEGEEPLIVGIPPEPGGAVGGVLQVVLQASPEVRGDVLEDLSLP